MYPLPFSPERDEFACPDCKALLVEYTARDSVFRLAIHAYEEEVSRAEIRLNGCWYTWRTHGRPFVRRG